MSSTPLRTRGSLARIERADPQQARIAGDAVFWRYDVEEIGKGLDISPRTEKRDGAVAKRWLHRALS